MSGLPRKYAKMGFKKGWAMFKHKSHSIKSKGGVTTMARRMKRSRSRISYKRSRRRSSSNNSFGNIGNVLIGSGIALAYEKFASPLIPVSNPILHDAVDFGIGMFASKKSGVIGNAGKALMIINAYRVMEQLMGGMSIGGTAGNSSAQILG